MALTAQEEPLIGAVGTLPPEEVGKVLNWVEWSDSWNDEDLADATAAAMKRLEDCEREDS